jgi:2'-5' RNA ligase
VPRVRLGVVLLLPPPVAHEVDGLRRALGDPALDRVPPHITLVPPVNVGVDGMKGVLATLRAAAAQARPIVLELGPPRTFDTDEGVVYLEVSGRGDAPDALAALHEGCGSGPLDRPREHAFVPHVTLTTGVAPDHVRALLEVIGGFSSREVVVDRLHLLQQEGAPPHRWEPVADVPLGPAVIVGRGGLPVELTSSELVDPEGLAFLADRDPNAVPDELGRSDPTEGTRALVVVARREGVVVGVARGWTAGPVAEPVSTLVADVDDGTADHLRAAWRSAAADRGAS